MLYMKLTIYASLGLPKLHTATSKCIENEIVCILLNFLVFCLAFLVFCSAFCLAFCWCLIGCLGRQTDKSFPASISCLNQFDF